MKGRSLCLVIFSSLVTSAVAHDHDAVDIPEGEYISVEPIDSILWAHIAIMMISFGLCFPVGMVLGLNRHRFHIPVQVFGTVLAIAGYFLGHSHKGREFSSGNVHSSFARFLMPFMFAQIAVGVFLKMHLERGLLGRIRGGVVKIHMVFGALMPVFSWVQMGFGGIVALGFCHGDHLGQCLAHGIMGSAFIAYGCILAIMLLVGQGWLARTGYSQEFLDSAVITAWGIVNTFTEHRWGQKWSHGDYQHTSMGIVWWAAGLIGLLLSRSHGRPKRNFIPSFVIILTGWAMSVHAQHLELSTKVHAMFGYALMSAGLFRLIEIGFILRDAPTEGDPHSWQYMPPFLLVASGFLFMCANEEQLMLIYQNGIDHSSYTLIIFSLSCVVFFYFLILIRLWQQTSGNDGMAIKYEVAGDDSSMDLEMDEA
ncbi:uncharacterized protein V1516DRAFT_506867 [Lipomyces oligophaga]|uniref:uncharacterized protein n=1 Tax=Lipomyces oligophaga TaxID=45792 RepID=UPI0034CE4D5C